jgi:hypothetical protein
MCEFCHKHGEGKKWYLKAENYSEDLLSDLNRRKFIADFFSRAQYKSGLVERVGKLRTMPGFVKRVLSGTEIRSGRKCTTGRFADRGCGEDLRFCQQRSPAALLYAAIVNLGTEQRFCYGISMVPQEGEMFKIIRESTGTT